MPLIPEAAHGWGRHTLDPLGIVPFPPDNAQTYVAPPIPAFNMDGWNWLAFAVGVDKTIGLRIVAPETDGTVWWSGNNEQGAGGQGFEEGDPEFFFGSRGADIDNPNQLRQVLGVGGSGFLTGIIQVAAYGNTFEALGSNGKVYSWGEGSSGEHGDGNTTAQQTTPVEVSGITTAVHLAPLTGGAVLANGTVQNWGVGTNGSLGDGLATDSLVPVTMSGITTAVQVHRGLSETIVLLASGELKACGGNTRGGVGDGTTTQRNTAVSVLAVGGVGNLSGVTQLSGGDEFFLALLSTEKVAAWGANGAGQLGDNTQTDRSTPVLVKDVPTTGDLSNIKYIAAGYGVSMASPAYVEGDVNWYAWGIRNGGILSYDFGLVASPEYQLTPIEVDHGLVTVNDFFVVHLGQLSAIVLSGIADENPWAAHQVG